MAATLNDAKKYSFKYTASELGSGSSTRTITGLNIRAGEDAEAYHVPMTAQLLYNLVGAFSTATISNVRWIQEQGVSGL